MQPNIIIPFRCIKLCVYLVMVCCVMFYGYAYLQSMYKSKFAASTNPRPLLTSQQSKKSALDSGVHSTISSALNLYTENIEHLQSSFTNTSFNVTKTKVILLWNPFFGSWSYLPYGQSGFLNCPVSNCEVTSNRDRLLESSAILFHVRDLSLTDLPLIRLPEQRWIFYCLESPIYSYFGGFHFMNNMFNWTMTYRFDSDVVVRYGGYKRIRKNSTDAEDENLYKLWKKKTGIAVWMVSHCSTSSKREDFVDKLQNYVDVDIYGLCGTATCPRNMTKQCLKRFEERYVFMLALENAICEDYVTEKFFGALEYNMIPVVLGGANYSRIAPPNSFIDALQFQSPKKLARYMYKVAKDFKLFSSYLSWKKKYHVFRFDDGLCEFCSKLHDNSLGPFAYQDLKHWWIDQSKCHAWQDTES